MSEGSSIDSLQTNEILREILNNFTRVQQKPVPYIEQTKTLPSFCPPSACMDHTPCKLGIKEEQRIHSNSGFVLQSDSILSFSQISKDAHMAQK